MQVAGHIRSRVEVSNVFPAREEVEGQIRAGREVKWRQSENSVLEDEVEGGQGKWTSIVLYMQYKCVVY